MSKRKKIILDLPFIVCALFFCNVKAQNTSGWPNPKIEIGTSKVSGNILNYQRKQGEKLNIIIYIDNPLVDARPKSYITQINSDNHFSISIPTVLDNTLVYCNIKNGSSYLWGGFIGLNKDIEKKICLDFKDKNNLIVTTNGGFYLTQDDAQNIGEACIKFEGYPQERSTLVYKMTPKEFATYKLNKALKERDEYALGSLPITTGTKEFLIKYFNIRYIEGMLFFYKKEVDADAIYMKLKNFKAVEPDKSYYSFLKNYNLNDPELLYSVCLSTPYYPIFLKCFLGNKVFNIPKIGDTPTAEWLNIVKSHVKDVIGISDGLFYDVLAAYAYSSQITEDRIALTHKQIENVNEYFKNHNKDIAAIIFKLNETAPKKAPKKVPPVIKSVPNVAANKLMDAIVSKHRGKVVFIDIWATWCSSCLSAIKVIRNIKDSLRSKGVDFVYIADTSSPKFTWLEEIKSIGDEHYYLNKKLISQLMNIYNINGYPSYLIYDRQGYLRNKLSGFPDIDKLRSQFKEILKP